MGSPTAVLLMLTLAAAPPPQGVAGEEGADAYEITVAAAMPVLPKPLRTFYESRVEAVRRAAVAERYRQAGVTGCDGRHYLMLDADARGTDQSEWHAAAQTFPHDRRQAERLFLRNEIDIGGSLPWSVAGAYRRLVSAFREQDEAAIIEATGVLCHYSCDAALPFHVSRAGTGAGNIRDRLQHHLIARLRSRLDYEVRVAPTRYQETAAPIEATFATMIAAHATLVTLMSIDADINRERAGVSSATNLDAYYNDMMQRTADVMETRLEAGALLAADLIGSAWTSTGRPSLSHHPKPTTEVTDNTATTTTYVGSRNSTIFHRSDCSHTRRIKPANRTGFPSAAAAAKAGRSPCKTCKPGIP